MPDRLRESYAQRSKPWFEDETTCERCRREMSELRRLIELGLWVCEECYAEVIALIEAGAEVERKPVATESAEPRQARMA